MTTYFDPPDKEWTRVPNELLHDVELSPTARLVLMHALSNRSDWEEPAWKTAQRLGINRDTATKAINELVKAGHARSKIGPGERGRPPKRGWDFAWPSFPETDGLSGLQPKRKKSAQAKEPQVVAKAEVSRSGTQPQRPQPELVQPSTVRPSTAGVAPLQDDCLHTTKFEEDDANNKTTSAPPRAAAGVSTGSGSSATATSEAPAAKPRTKTLAQMSDVEAQQHLLDGAEIFLAVMDAKGWAMTQADAVDFVWLSAVQLINAPIMGFKQQRRKSLTGIKAAVATLWANAVKPTPEHLLDGVEYLLRNSKEHLRFATNTWPKFFGEEVQRLMNPRAAYAEVIIPSGSQKDAEAELASKTVEQLIEDYDMTRTEAAEFLAGTQQRSA